MSSSVPSGTLEKLGEGCVAFDRVGRDAGPQPRRAAALLRRSDQIAALGDDAARAVGAPLLLDLGAEVDVGGKERLDRAVPRVPRGEHLRGRVEVAVGEGDDAHWLGRIELSARSTAARSLAAASGPSQYMT